MQLSVSANSRHSWGSRCAYAYYDNSPGLGYIFRRSTCVDLQWVQFLTLQSTQCADLLRSRSGRHRACRWLVLETRNLTGCLRRSWPSQITKLQSMLSAVSAFAVDPGP